MYQLTRIEVWYESTQWKTWMITRYDDHHNQIGESNTAHAKRDAVAYAMKIADAQPNSVEVVTWARTKSRAK